jgi:hypothetical protein
MLKTGFVILVILLTTGNASAQQRTDSVEARRSAMRAQATFEQIRRQNLPVRWVEAPRSCDAYIGRFCQWNSGDDTVAAKEPRVIRRARASLLKSLDGAAARSPRDGWITGQRVRYLLEARDDSGAVAVARSCTGTQWWCEALRGLTLHETGTSAGADSAFGLALSAMPTEERCRWTDMTPILDAAQKKRYGRVGCGRNDEIAARLWWLADPFLSIPGNDRQAEHFSRHTMARILAPARNAYNITWANDMRDMIVRYGWARYWTKGPGTTLEGTGGSISGHEATPNYHFIPASAALDSMHAIAFDLDQQRSPERYAPVIANRLADIAPQVALFRRGDSVQVVAAFDVSRVVPFDSARVTSSLVLAADEQSPSILTGQTPKGTFSETIDGRPHLMSLEVVSFDKRHAAWKRSGVWLPPASRGDIELSDVLLFEPAGTEVTDLSQALPGALPGYSLKRGKVGVYWELYGLARADSALPVSLTLTPVGRSTIRRIGESIGLAPRSSALNISWRDTPGAGVISTRSVVLDLSLIPRGKYQLRVEARPAGRPPASASRTIEIQ